MISSFSIYTIKIQFDIIFREKYQEMGFFFGQLKLNARKRKRLCSKQRMNSKRVKYSFLKE